MHEHVGGDTQRIGAPVAGRRAPTITPALPVAVSEPAAQDSGQPLDRDTRQAMERLMGADFAAVRIHSDSRHRAAAAMLSASAYTVGEDIVVGHRLDPTRPADRRLIAHELAHVVQQRQGSVPGVPIGPGVRLGRPSDRLERAADAVADQATRPTPPRSADRPARPPAGRRGIGTPVTIQRQSLGGTIALAATMDPSALSDSELRDEYWRIVRLLWDSPAGSLERQLATDYLARIEAAAASRPNIIAIGVPEQPTPADMTNLIIAQRGFASRAPTPRRPQPEPLDFQGSSSFRLGRGYEVNAAVSVLDSNGVQVAAALGRYGRGSDPDAEQMAVNELTARMLANSVPGGTVAVVVDQAPCDDCRAALIGLATHLGCARVTAYGPSTPAARGGGRVALRTAARMSATPSPRGRPPIETIELWTVTIPTGAGPGRGGGGGGGTSRVPPSPAVDVEPVANPPRTTPAPRAAEPEPAVPARTPTAVRPATPVGGGVATTIAGLGTDIVADVVIGLLVSRYQQWIRDRTLHDRLVALQPRIEAGRSAALRDLRANHPAEGTAGHYYNIYLRITATTRIVVAAGRAITIPGLPVPVVVGVSISTRNEQRLLSDAEAAHVPGLREGATGGMIETTETQMLVYSEPVR